MFLFFFFQAEDGIRDGRVTGVQTCALPILVAIDYNSAAPQAARPDLFPLQTNSQVRGRVNEIGWLAAGVPGTLAGMQLDRNERRVGKECRSRRAREQETQKKDRSAREQPRQ